MNISNYYGNQILTHALGGASLSAITTVYVGLFTDNPTAADTGTEVSGGGYARAAITFDITANTATNNALVNFPTATTDWGTITHLGIYDAASGGNLLLFGSLSANLSVLTDDDVRLPIEGVDVLVS